MEVINNISSCYKMFWKVNSHEFCKNKDELLKNYSKFSMNTFKGGYFW